MALKSWTKWCSSIPGFLSGRMGMLQGQVSWYSRKAVYSHLAQSFSGYCFKLRDLASSSSFTCILWQYLLFPDACQLTLPCLPASSYPFRTSVTWLPVPCPRSASWKAWAPSDSSSMSSHPRSKVILALSFVNKSLPNKGVIHSSCTESCVLRLCCPIGNLEVLRRAYSQACQILQGSHTIQVSLVSPVFKTK